MLVLKGDAELFQDLPDGRVPDEGWTRTFGGEYQEAADRYRAEVAQGKIRVEYGGGPWSAEEELQMAIDRDAYKVFQKLQWWIEGNLYEGVPIRQFPQPVIPLYTVGNPKRLCQVDFFHQLERDTGRLDKLAQPLRAAVRAQEPQGGGLGCLLRCFLWLLGALFAVAVGASSGQTAVTLASMVVMAVCLFQALRTILNRPRRVKKEARRQAAAEFHRLAEENLPRMHLLLRFYTLWAEYEQIALPDNVQEMQRFFDEMVARYEEGS